MLKPRYVIAAVAIVIAVVFVIVIGADMFGAGGEQRVDFRLSEGDGTAAVAKKLKLAGVISNELAFKVYAKLTGRHIYQLGIHELNSSMSYSEIIDELVTMPESDEVTVLIPEGYELRQIADVLEESGLINRDVFMREAQVGSFDYPFIDKIPDRENRLEGYLFPDTYMFSGTESEHEIINTMLANFNRIVVPLYEQAETEYTLDEIVTLASIIEREAAGDEDRGKVASVFVNRIGKNMRLESCATVQYLLKERKSILSNDDIKIESPYNTYINFGLPPGPIAAPGKKSVEAALYPEQTSYLYFLATADGSASLFSETFEEHLANQRATQGN